MNEYVTTVNQLYQIYLDKNYDYGNSFDCLYDEFGLTSSIIRIQDKLNRLKQLNKTRKIKVKDEAIKDTVMDLANYAIMTAMRL